LSETVKAIILGIIQGLSEFLPISSSGHLVLFGVILDFKEHGIAFEIFVHFGTLVAVLIVFRKDIWEMIRRLPAVPEFIKNGMKIQSKEDEYKAMSFFIIIGSIPVAFFGILFKEQITGLFESTILVLIALFVTALIMWSSRYTKEKQGSMNWFHALLIGFAQTFAVIPGISRSGSTIVTGLWLGINRETAARFSFLLSIPVILGASILKFNELLADPPSANDLLNLILGTVAAAISGYFAIIWLLDIIRKQKLEWFGLYCAIVSLLGILIFLLKNWVVLNF
jgi:undecaprenyl-diphosphatase